MEWLMGGTTTRCEMFATNYPRAGLSWSRLSIRWGTSPAGNYKYLGRIPSPIMQSLNQALRGVRIPGWRGMDPGHWHIWF
jgi:hypothetical protein